MCNILLTIKTIPELMNFYHETCLSLENPTWIAVIEQGFFQIWPNPTVKNMKLYLIEYISMQLDYMKQAIQGMK